MAGSSFLERSVFSRFFELSTLSRVLVFQVFKRFFLFSRAGRASSSGHFERERNRTCSTGFGELEFSLMFLSSLNFIEPSLLSQVAFSRFLGFLSSSNRRDKLERPSEAEQVWASSAGSSFSRLPAFCQFVVFCFLAFARFSRAGRANSSGHFEHPSEAERAPSDFGGLEFSRPLLVQHSFLNLYESF